MYISKRSLLLIAVVFLAGLVALAAYLDSALYRLALGLFAAHP
jgi:hypothetical protein